jgi:hypothetical protein
MIRMAHREHRILGPLLEGIAWALAVGAVVVAVLVLG